MIRCGKTGATLLYGTKCAHCDCHLSRFADGGIIPQDTDAPRMMGFDTASEPDRSVAYRIHLVDDELRYTFNDIEIDMLDLNTRQADQMTDFIKRHHEEIERAMYGKRWEHAADPRPRRDHWGPPPHRQAVEIITDPSDRRGFDAKRIGGTST